MIIYLTDNAGIYTGETFTITDPLKPLPRGVPVEPPALTGTEVAQWVVSRWTVLPERPVPPEPVPASITMRQCRLQLLATGKLALVAPAIAALPSPQKEAAEIEWEYGAVVLRSSPLIAQLAPVLGWNTPEEIDEQFRQAARL